MRSSPQALERLDRGYRESVAATASLHYGLPAPAARTVASARQKGSAVDLQLDGKVTLVTGASKGIGRHGAEHLAAEGANVAITARTAAPLEATAKEIRAPRASFGSGARIPVDRAQRETIMDR